MTATWSGLMGEVLCEHKFKHVAIAERSRAVITSGPEVAHFEDGVELGTTIYHATGYLCNINGQMSDEYSFLLPSVNPEQNPSSYSINMDKTTGIFHVASCYRYVSLREYLESSASLHFVEFSEGKMVGMTRKQNLNTQQQSAKGQVLTLDTSFGNTFSENISEAEIPELGTSTTAIFDINPPVPSLNKVAASLTTGTDHSETSFEPTTPPSSTSGKALAETTRFQQGHEPHRGSKDDLSIMHKQDLHFESPLYDLVMEDQLAVKPMMELDLSFVTFHTPKPPSIRGVLRVDESGNIHLVGQEHVSEHAVHCTALLDSETSNQGNSEETAWEVSSDQGKNQGVQESTKDLSDDVVDASLSGPPCLVNQEAVKSLPSFSIETKHMSQSCIALDLLPFGREAKSEIPLSHLDLAYVLDQRERLMTASEEDTPGFADIADAQIDDHFQSWQSQNMKDSEAWRVHETEVEAVRDGHMSSKEFMIHNERMFEDQLQQGVNEDDTVPRDNSTNTVINSQSEDSSSRCPTEADYESMNLDAVFGDDEEYYDDQSKAPIVRLPVATPTIVESATKILEVSQSLRLQYELDERTMALMKGVNGICLQLRKTSYLGRNFIDVFDDEMVLRLAMVTFESMNRLCLSEVAVQLIKQHVDFYNKIWRSPKTNRPKDKWIAGEDEQTVEAIAIKFVEWIYSVSASREKRETLRLQPGSMEFEESQSSSDWYLQAIGGDSAWREHRRVKTNASNGEESQAADAVVHHINFNCHAVSQRCYTPPEVSFWAAATTYSKVLLGKEGLPNVHYARVLASQAFRWVDPVVFTGEDINEIWRKKGTALRDAATSDVKVVYQAEGTWMDNEYNEDEVPPMIAPIDNRYEYATNGNYHYFQVPYLFNIKDGEHDLYHVNEERPSGFHPVHLRDRKPRGCPLRYELGEELTKKAALLEEKLEKRFVPKKISFMDTVTEEFSTVEETTDVQINEEAVPEVKSDTHGNVEIEDEPAAHIISDASTVSSTINEEVTGEGETREEEPTEEPLKEDAPAEEIPREATDEGKTPEEQPTEEETPVEKTTAEEIPEETTGEEETREEQPAVEETPAEETPQEEAAEENAEEEDTASAVIPQTSAPIDQVTLDILAGARLFEQYGKAKICAEQCAHNRARGEPWPCDDEEYEESDKESLDGDNGITDHTCPVVGVADPRNHPHAEHLARFSDEAPTTSEDSDDDLETPASPILKSNLATSNPGSQRFDAVEQLNGSQNGLQDGRFFSPSKMISSHIGEPRTPIQSPSNDSDVDVWEVDEHGNYVTPRVSNPSMDAELSGELDSAQTVHSFECEDPFTVAPVVAAVETGAIEATPLKSHLPLSVRISRSSHAQEQSVSLQPAESRRFIPTISPIAEAQFETDSPSVHRNSADLMLPRRRQHSRPMNKDDSSYSSAEGVSSHSRKSSTDESSNNASSASSRSTSISEPMPDSEIFHGWAQEAETNEKVVAASKTTKLNVSPVRKDTSDLSKALVLVRKRTDSRPIDNISWENFEHPPRTYKQSARSLTKMLTEGLEMEFDDNQKAMDNPLSTNRYLGLPDIQALQSSKTQQLTICHYTLIDIPPTVPCTPPQSQQGNQAP